MRPPTRLSIATPGHLGHPIVSRSSSSLGPRRPRLPSVGLSVAPAQPAAASSALQSGEGRFVRAPEAGQYFAAGSGVLGGRPSKGREWGPVRASFPYVRGQHSQKRCSRGLRRASSPPADPPPPPTLRDGPLLRLPRRPLPACCSADARVRARCLATRFLAADSHHPAADPEGDPQPVPMPGPPGRAGPRRRRGGSTRPPSTPRPRDPGPREPTARSPRPGAQAPGVAAGTMAAGALGTRRRRRRWQLDGRTQRARLPAPPRPPEALDGGEEGPGPRGEEEPGRRLPGRDSSSAARAAGAAEGGALGAARALSESVRHPPFHGDCSSCGRSPEVLGPDRWGGRRGVRGLLGRGWGRSAT